MPCLPPKPLKEILVANSTYSRGTLKRRLYAEGLKAQRCELCGQGSVWRGKPIALILDHINGVADDNRLENLRIVCPNCAATLPTHCGRNGYLVNRRECARCGTTFQPKSGRQRYCSRACGTRHDRRPRQYPQRRKVDRPPYPQLLREVEAMGYLATGRRYGVSDNAIRKWVRAYEQDAAAEEGS